MLGSEFGGQICALEHLGLEVVPTMDGTALAVTSIDLNGEAAGGAKMSPIPLHPHKLGVRPPLTFCTGSVQFKSPNFCSELQSFALVLKDGKRKKKKKKKKQKQKKEKKRKKRKKEKKKRKKKKKKEKRRKKKKKEKSSDPIYTNPIKNLPRKRVSPFPPPQKRLLQVQPYRALYH